MTPADINALGIAVVGAGDIVDGAHLPSYLAHGLRVVGIHDACRSAAERVATNHGIDRVYDTIDQLLADDDVRVVDVAVPPQVQGPIALAAMRAGRHVLCQKPLALDLATAVGIAEAASAARVHAAVNQQMRFEEAMVTCKAILDSGEIGDLVSLTFRSRGRIDWERRSWTAEAPRLEIPFHAIHYLDIIRFLGGHPTAVSATCGRRPGGQAVRGETRVMALMHLPGGAHALLDADHDPITGSFDDGAPFRIEGTRGAIAGDIGWTSPTTLRVATVGSPGWEPAPGDHELATAGVPRTDAVVAGGRRDR